MRKVILASLFLFLGTSAVAEELDETEEYIQARNEIGLDCFKNIAEGANTNNVKYFATEVGDCVKRAMLKGYELGILKGYSMREEIEDMTIEELEEHIESLKNPSD